jgi:hypothetical protein
LPAWAFDNEPVKNKQKTLGEVPILTLGTHFQCLREVMSTESRSLRCQALESIVSLENPHIPVKSCKSVSSYKSYTGWWFLTILKNISQWEGLSHISDISWKIKHVPNHQQVTYSSKTWFSFTRLCFKARIAPWLSLTQDVIILFGSGRQVMNVSVQSSNCMRVPLSP